MRAQAHPPIPARPSRWTLCALAAVLLGWAMGCGAGVSQQLPGRTALSEREMEVYSRRHLLDARALRDEGRLEAAARVAARGLELRPDNADLQRLRAELLEALGRSDEARAHRRVADLLDPPAPPPPDAPVSQSSQGLVVALLPPSDDPRLADRVPSRWPDGDVARALEQRIRTRLPQARLHHAERDEPASVGAGRAWLGREGARAAISLRVDRAFCRESLKDGRFAVAWLRVAAAVGDRAAPPARQVRTVLENPEDPSLCREDAIARAFGEALQLDEVRAALGARPGDRPFSTAGIRSLFPDLGRRIVEEIDAGRDQMRLGDLEAALAHFRAATEIDPEDLDAQAFLDDAEVSVAMARQLAPVSTRTDPRGPARPGGPAESRSGGTGPLPSELGAASAVPLFSPAERRRLEARLAEEQRRRDELLAALAVLDDDREAPDSEILGTLRPGAIRDADAVGPQLARQRAPRDLPIRVEVLFAPDGSSIARYYFAGDSTAPLLREEDGDGDGQPDRWIAYESGTRARVWEDRQGNGRPDLILVFAPGGDPLERLEIDTDGDGQPERIFRYADGRLYAEDRDTNGDGRADLFERFDDSGALTLREQDMNGDGNVDVRTAYSAGRMVRREIVNPEAVIEIQ
ncbi:MAG: hypothetical protein ACQGVK_04285 [Myxococcota bacterium]